MLSRLITAANNDASDYNLELLGGTFLVVGALIALLSSFITSFWQLRRADRARWDERILQSALAIKDVMDSVLSVKQFKDDKAITDRTSKFSEIEPTIKPLIDELKLIASKKLSGASEDLLNQVFVVSFQSTAADLQVQLDVLTATHEKFQKAVRRELRAKK